MRIELIFTAEKMTDFWSAVALPNYAMFHVGSLGRVYCGVGDTDPKKKSIQSHPSHRTHQTGQKETTEV